MEKTKAKVTITAVTPKKSGTSTSKKTGQPFKWTISEVNVIDTATQKKATLSTFDDFTGKEGQDLEVMIWKETNESGGKVYENWKMELPKRSVWQEIDDLKARVKLLEDKSPAKDLERATQANQATPSTSSGATGDTLTDDIDPDDIDPENLPF